MKFTSKEVLNKMWNMYFLKWKYLYLTKYKSYYKKRMNNIPQENKKTMSYHKENNYDKKDCRIDKLKMFEV